jgi:tetratricopeptide (TPR) repeat protein
MSHEGEATIHSDISVRFDKFIKDRVERVDILPDNKAYVLYNLFTLAECERIIEACEKIGFDKLHGYDPRYRNNVRIVCEADTIVSEMNKRVKYFVEQSLTMNTDSDTMHRHKGVDGIWDYSHLNNRLRICKYNPKNRFGKHYDAGYHPDPINLRTIKTCMVYLNDNFEGGHTRFYKGSLEKNDNSHELFYSLKAKPEMCLVFNQNILHDGEEVNDGLKYMMRTDIIYKCIKKFNVLTDKERKAMRLYNKAVDLEADGKLDESLTLYKKAFHLDPDVEVLCND